MRIRGSHIFIQHLYIRQKLQQLSQSQVSDHFGKPVDTIKSLLLIK